jgi:hypothetical protein
VNNPNYNKIYCIYSRDDGKSWSTGGFIETERHNDNTFLSYGDGYFMLLIGRGYTFYSYDHGLTWNQGGYLDINPLNMLFGNGSFLVTGSGGTNPILGCKTSDILHWKTINQYNKDNINNLELTLNGYEIIPRDIGNPLYLRVVQPMDYHTRVPGTNFYMYSFCLDPENPNPTGHINFGRISDQVLNLNLVLNPLPRVIRVYARSYNIFIVEKGIAKVLFNG